MKQGFAAGTSIAAGILLATVGVLQFLQGIAAIVIAALSIIVNFLWLPYYPGWSLAIIAIDVVVIWAVSTWDADRTWDAGRTEPGYRP